MALLGGKTPSIDAIRPPTRAWSRNPPMRAGANAENDDPAAGPAA